MTYLTQDKKSILGEISEILRFRQIIITFAVMDLKLRYRNSIIGIGWSFLEPLLILSILNLVFSSILKNNIEHFPIFLILSLTMFNMFTRSTSSSIESILGRSNIVKATYLRKEIFPIASNLTAFFMMLIEFFIVFLFIGIFQFVPTSTIVILPYLLILLFVFSLGLSFPLSALNVRFRDVRIIWAVITQALFFLTPIFYQISFLPKPISDVVKLNPLAQMIEIAHNAVLYDKFPSVQDISYVTIISIAVLIVGWSIFRKMNTTIDEMI